MRAGRSVLPGSVFGFGWSWSFAGPVFLTFCQRIMKVWLWQSRAVFGVGGQSVVCGADRPAPDPGRALRTLVPVSEARTLRSSLLYGLIVVDFRVAGESLPGVTWVDDLWCSAVATGLVWSTETWADQHWTNIGRLSPWIRGWGFAWHERIIPVTGSTPRLAGWLGWWSTSGEAGWFNPAVAGRERGFGGGCHRELSPLGGVCA